VAKEFAETLERRAAQRDLKQNASDAQEKAPKSAICD
jgi:hypothetical protein